jgi:cell division protein FtsL
MTDAADPILNAQDAAGTLTEEPNLWSSSYLAIFLAVAFTIAAVVVLGTWYRRRNAASSSKDAVEKKTGEGALLDTSNSVGVADLAYLVEKLHPVSTHMDLLLTVCSTPENIEWSMAALEKVELARKERIEKKKLEKPKNETEKAFDFDSMMDEGGWDEDDDDDDEDEQVKETRLKAKKAEAEKQADMARFKQAAGQTVQLMEGIDDGVLGQEWVEETLSKAKVWPPADIGLLKDAKFDYKGKKVSALDHPALRRNLCMTIGRLNSQMLNSHPELLEAGSKKLIDYTYFRASMEFRQRVGILLEAALRVAMTLRSYRLVTTIVETVAMFKIGCPHDSLGWFEDMMKRQYDCLPRCIVQSHTMTVPGENEIATGDMCELTLELERTHAEKFLRQKIAMFQKQGIPPQVGLQSYREGWWIALRVERLDGKAEVDKLNRENTILNQMDPKEVDKFEKEDPGYRLIVAWPMVVQNVAQKTGKASIQVKAPSVPGKYRYFVGIKSQDFLGADVEMPFDVEVVDASTVVRTEKKPPAVESEAATVESEETKKIN